MTTHMVKRAKTPNDLELQLDNAAYRGWSVVSVLLAPSEGVGAFWVIFRKDSVDD